jgi:hypothetical protein
VEHRTALTEACLNDPRPQLALANRYLEEAEARIADQRRRIDQLRRHRIDTTAATYFLRRLQEMFESIRTHQERLQREMTRWRVRN